MAVVINNVKYGSPAYKFNIFKDEILISINSNIINDVLDYRFYQFDSKLVLKIKGLNGIIRIVEVEKDEYDELGLEFDTYLMDKQKNCKNKCIFCFIDQLPPDMRESLYFKDDDSRLSFLFGNYITLTNLTDHEINRIIKMHISPINISVHTTNPILRNFMMGNRFAGEKLSILKKFANAGIQINCQLVLCPGINDGIELERTLHDLSKLYPSVSCIAAVPVGLTKYRDNLYHLEEYDEKSASQVIDIIENFGNKFKDKHDTRLAFPADEFYLCSNRPIPPKEFYEDFAQLENGVGLISLLESEFKEALANTTYNGSKRYITIATGKAAFPLMKKLLNNAINKYSGLNGKVICIINNYFGEKITVSGLITATDIIEQLKNLYLGDELLISSSMLKNNEDIFLDDITLKDLQNALNVNIKPVPNDGQILLNSILGSDC